jgi:hypothetical protein
LFAQPSLRITLAGKEEFAFSNISREFVEVFFKLLEGKNPPI